jgi:hypothetical protein
MTKKTSRPLLGGIISNQGSVPSGCVAGRSHTDESGRKSHGNDNNRTLLNTSSEYKKIRQEKLLVHVYVCIHMEGNHIFLDIE